MDPYARIESGRDRPVAEDQARPVYPIRSVFLKPWVATGSAACLFGALPLIGRVEQHNFPGWLGIVAVVSGVVMIGIGVRERRG